jgi:hypothetical protein
MRMIVEQLVEWRMTGKTEVLGENLPQRYFVHHKIPHDQTRARTPGHRGGKPATNRLSYGAALQQSILIYDEKLKDTPKEISGWRSLFSALNRSREGVCCWTWQN